MSPDSSQDGAPTTAESAPPARAAEKWRRRWQRLKPLLAPEHLTATGKELYARARQEAKQRGLRPRAWLGTPREWLNYRRKRFWAAAVFLLYTFSGFVLVPWIAKPRIVAAVEGALHRKAALDELRFNPFVFSVDLRGFRLTEDDGAPIAGLDRFYVNFQLSSVLRFAWCFGDVRLDGLRANIIRYSETDTNIGRVLQSIEAPAAETPPEEEKPTRLVVRKLRIHDARIDVTDHVPGTVFKTEVGPVDVAIDRLSTLPKALSRVPRKKGLQPLVIDLENGARIEWTGKLGLNPLSSTGHVSTRGTLMNLLARYFESTTKIVATGESNGDFDYELKAGADGALALSVSDLAIALQNVAMREAGTAAPFMSLPELQLSGGHMAWPERAAGAEALTLSGLELNLLREENGQLSLQRLLAPKGKPAAPPDTEAVPAQQAKEEWSALLSRFEIKDAKLRLEDKALHVPGSVQVSNLNLGVGNISNASGAVLPVTFDTRVMPGGLVKFNGNLTLLPTLKLDAKLVTSDLQVAVVEPYVRDYAKVRIENGKLNFETDIKMPDLNTLEASGHMELNTLKVSDEVKNEPVVAWERVGIDRFQYRQAENALDVSEIAIGAPYLSFHVFKDRTTNFSEIMNSDAKPPATAPSGDTSQSKRQEPMPIETKDTAATPMNITIGRVTIEGGSADFSDQSLPLPFAAHVTDLAGNITTLATDTKAPARVALKGQVGKFGEAKIDGYLTPFDPVQKTKIALLFRNVEFPDLSPYTLKFAGRRIAKGRLDVDLKYALDRGKLDGANRVVIRNIELGEKEDVPGAKTLPLGLAIALLKDRSGKIDVNLPVRGDVNDPKFAIGSVIWDAVLNLFTNIATAPFRALAGLAGMSGQNLDEIQFAAGDSGLSPPEREKILQVAQALSSRPTLALTVPAVVDPEADRFSLQLKAVDAKVTKKLGEKGASEDESRRWTTRQRKILEGEFKDKINKDEMKALRAQFVRPTPSDSKEDSDLDEPAYVEALRERVAKAEPIGDADLDALGAARANAVVEALKQAPGLDPARVGLGGGEKAKAGQDGLIPLKLGAKSVTAKEGEP